MYDSVQTSDHHNPLSHMSNDNQIHHHRGNSSESLSFRHFYHHSTPNAHYIHDTFENFIHKSNTTPCASPTLLSPESSPLLMAQSPESRWSISSPPRTPPIYHHPPPLLYHSTFSLRHHDENIHSIVVARGLIFTASNTPCIRAWQQSNCCEMGYIRANSGEVRAMLAHGNMLFTSHKDHKIRVWSISPCTCEMDGLIRPRKLATLPKPKLLQLLISKPSSQQHKDTISCMAYNLSDRLLYTGSYDKTVKAWSLTDRKCIDTFAAHSDNINAMVINEDGYLFTCSSDGTLKMWSKVCGETFHTLTMTLHFHPFPIYTLALTQVSITEASFLYAGASDGCIYVWEQQISGEYSRRGCIQGHQFGVLSLAVFEDMVISGSADTTIKIWRRNREYRVYHECVGVLEGHKGPVKCIVACLEEDCFVRGFMVFSAGLDRTFKAWKVKVLPEIKGGNQFLDCGIDDGQ